MSEDSSKTSHPAPPAGEQKASSRLETWQEIAGYLGVSVRTAQNWKAHQGLPIYRQGSGPRARAVAYREELDRWRQSFEKFPHLPLGQKGKGEARTVSYGALALVALMLVVAGIVWRGRRQPGPPARSTLEKGALRVWDSQGKLCWEKQFSGIVQTEYQQRRAAQPRSVFETSVIVADLDGDGRTEVVFDALDFDRAKGKIICYEENGRVHWEYDYARGVSDGARSWTGQFLADTIGVRVFHWQGRSFLLTVAHHRDWYPCHLMILDPGNGRLVFEYWHPGWIESLVLRDLDRDGLPEVVMAGINNPGEGPGLPTLVVLKLPRNLGQFRTSVSERDLFGFEGSRPVLTSILLPLPDVFSSMQTGLYAYALRVTTSDRLVFQVGHPGEDVAVHYVLDSHLRVVDVRPSDGLSFLHHQMEAAGTLTHPLTEAETRAWRNLHYFHGRTPNANQIDFPRIARPGAE